MLTSAISVFKSVLRRFCGFISENSLDASDRKQTQIDLSQWERGNTFFIHGTKKFKASAGLISDPQLCFHLFDFICKQPLPMWWPRDVSGSLRLVF